MDNVFNNQLGHIAQNTDDVMDQVTIQSISECEQQEQAMIRERLQNLMEEAPSDANLHVFLRRIRDGYHGVILVASAQGEFREIITARKVVNCLDTLCTRVEKQLRNWRSRRAISYSQT